MANDDYEINRDFAKRYESDALFEEREIKKKRMPSSEDLRKVYNTFKMAGGYREEAGEFRIAKIDYERALSFATFDFLKKDMMKKIGEMDSKINPPKIRDKSLERLTKSKKKNGSVGKDIKNAFNRRINQPYGGYWGKSYAFLSIIFLFGALFLASANLTGYAVLGTNGNPSRLWGVCFFICGLMFTFLYLKVQNRK